MHVPGILAKAAEFRDQLALALRAADLMLAEAEAARTRPKIEDQVEAIVSGPSERRKAHKASVNP